MSSMGNLRGPFSFRSFGNARDQLWKRNIVQLLLSIVIPCSQSSLQLQLRITALASGSRGKGRNSFPCGKRGIHCVLGDKDSQSSCPVWVWNLADEWMRDQFIAGLASEPLRVKLIGKGHRHASRHATSKSHSMRRRWSCQKPWSNHICKPVNEKRLRRPAGAGKLHKDNPRKLQLRRLNSGLFLVSQWPSKSLSTAISVESLAILLTHAEEEHELGENSSSNRILSVMILLRRRLL